VTVVATWNNRHVAHVAHVVRVDAARPSGWLTDADLPGVDERRRYGVTDRRASPVGSTATGRVGVDPGAGSMGISVDDDEQLAARRSDPRYQRLMSATREAARLGYDAVSMRELANATHMSLTTVYQFCSSKDHLIAEAHVERMIELRDRVVRRPPRGRTAEERVLKVMRGIVAGLDRDDPLSWAMMRAMYAPDPGVRACRRALDGSFVDMVDAAMGDTDVPDRPDVIATLAHVVDSAILGWVNGGLEADGVYDEIARAVRVLLRSVEEPGASKRAPAVARTTAPTAKSPPRPARRAASR
jgi:TetR/AcrR family transcriptional regulator, cholesterol catabolism regulator